MSVFKNYTCDSFPLNSAKANIPKMTSIKLQDLDIATLPFSLHFLPLASFLTLPQANSPACVSLQTLGMCLPLCTGNSLISEVYLANTFIVLKSLFKIHLSKPYWEGYTWPPYLILQPGLPILPSTSDSLYPAVFFSIASWNTTYFAYYHIYCVLSVSLS